jgi:hypothetical protein
MLLASAGLLSHVADPRLYQTAEIVAAGGLDNTVMAARSSTFRTMRRTEACPALASHR